MEDVQAAPEAAQPGEAEAAEAQPGAAVVHATIRTYRQGLGDCHLVLLHGDSGRTYSILIDCGVALATPQDRVREFIDGALQDVIKTTGGRLDLLVATHEHWDHLSGFVQAADAFEKLAVNETWMGWTENPQDPQAQKLRAQRDDAVGKLRLAAAHMQLRATDSEPGVAASMLQFFGAAGRKTSRDALEAVRAKTERVRYCDPHDQPVELPQFGARIYVLGPPRDEAALRKILPSKRDGDAYGAALAAFENSVSSVLAGEDADKPFSSLYAIPEATAQGINFFQQRYYSGDAWRRIDTAWMADASEFALALDSLTNNTSLVLAIELDGVGVLLFAADAQIGSWQSWQELTWQVDGKTVTGPELLERTVFYKVGHHGSFNATLRKAGLERMRKLRTAIIPVDHTVAVRMRWGDIPLHDLEEALADVTERNGGHVLRTDVEPAADALGGHVRAEREYFEVQL
jgi:hypothetical protein